MSKQLLKEQIKFGHCDPNLFKQLKIVEGIENDAAIELLSKRATLMEIKKDKTVNMDDLYYYKLLLGDIIIREGKIIASMNSDVILINKGLVEYFQQEEKQRRIETSINMLLDISVFKGLSYHQLKQIIKESSFVKLNDNRILLHQGVVPTDCIILVEGQLQQYKSTEGVELVLNQNRKHFAIYECLNSKAMQFNVKTISECSLIKINRSSLLKFELDLKVKKEVNLDFSQFKMDIARKKDWLKFKTSK
ncbi:unnamed protein product (macronuclear) [Paramecium tetraurelia]|uniref:Cyclic nucleotide-binding domain-containing protein n=1 Tax=Paramecium tetraurelia TaxID=5888 RepID=A0CRA4_PARTE|nr:uncharacterized protein GSPATT00009636001 [Paramecium tetraurelia]CAK73321.1 unnamed protein product [Paramecium tetraurelia]|eukprot:XP_001440718.1 hypothetical protein (macronuclear) [Paramecium tetraurelia strain d4-2]